jgi:hypothetical protein
MNAPTAALKPPSMTPTVARKAAPGVDHATEIGIFFQTLSTMPHRPMAMDSAISPDVACASLAPAATMPCTTTAKELAKPTNATSRPISRLWREKSLNIEGFQ